MVEPDPCSIMIPNYLHGRRIEKHMFLALYLITKDTASIFNHVKLYEPLLGCQPLMARQPHHEQGSWSRYIIIEFFPLRNLVFITLQLLIDLPGVKFVATKEVFPSLCSIHLTYQFKNNPKNPRAFFSNWNSVYSMLTLHDKSRSI